LKLSHNLVRQIHQIDRQKRPTSRHTFTSTFCRGETPTTPAKRACTSVNNFININHSSRQPKPKTKRSKWQPITEGRKAMPTEFQMLNKLIIFEQ
jgi:hypothetical protein